MSVTEKEHLDILPNFFREALEHKKKTFDEEVALSAYTAGNILHCNNAINMFESAAEAVANLDENSIDFKWFNAKALEIKFRIEALPKNPFG